MNYLFTDPALIPKEVTIFRDEPVPVPREFVQIDRPINTIIDLI